MASTYLSRAQNLLCDNGELQDRDARLECVAARCPALKRTWSIACPRSPALSGLASCSNVHTWSCATQFTPTHLMHLGLCRRVCHAVQSIGASCQNAHTWS